MIDLSEKSLNPSKSEGSSSRLSELLSRREFQQAEQLITARLREDPEDPDTHYFHGVLRYLQGQLAPTVESLKKALLLDPKHTDAAICLSVLYNDIGKYDEAKRVFEQANQSVTAKASLENSEINRKFAVKHLEIADLYFRYRRFDEAIEEYGKAILLEPSNLEIRIRRAKAYAKKGFLTRSMQELQQLKHEYPEYIPARIQLGLLHYSQGNVLDAELEWEAVLEIDADHREAQAYLKMAQQMRTKV